MVRVLFLLSHLSPFPPELRSSPMNTLSVVSKKLFCEACREPVSVKESVLEQHLRSAKHGTGKKLFVSKKNKD